MKTKNKIQHTQGNWKMEVNSFEEITIQTEETCIASVYTDIINPEIGKANAKLIASAPELLQALIDTLQEFKDVVSEIEGFNIDDKEDKGSWKQAILKAQSAINKATGK
jgi:hypothetical protein